MDSSADVYPDVEFCDLVYADDVLFQNEDLEKLSRVSFAQLKSRILLRD